MKLNSKDEVEAFIGLMVAKQTSDTIERITIALDDIEPKLIASIAINELMDHFNIPLSVINFMIENNVYGKVYGKKDDTETC